MIHLLSIVVLAGLTAVQTQAADITIEVRGVRSADGQVYLAVHGPESEATFPSGQGVVAGLQQPARAGALRFEVRDLSPGRYAVSVFHDENGNGDLDTNLFGIPSEGYGFGNDASAAFGPPDFEDAAVTVGDMARVAVLTLNYSEPR